MKTTPLILLSTLCVLNLPAKAQIDLKESVKGKTEERTRQKTDQGIDAGLDKAEEGVKNLFKKKEKPAPANSGESEAEESGVKSGSTEKASAPAASSSKPADFKSYSKFDFIPGEKIISYQNFEEVNTGDFPGGWNTDASGEVVTVSNAPGKWLQLKGNGYFLPEFITKLPENFTIEYDLIAVPETDFNIGFYKNPEGESFNEPFIGNGAHIKCRVSTQGSWVQAANWYTEGWGPIDNSRDLALLDNNFSKPLHVSLTRQNERLRFYINEVKVFDLPKLLPPGELSAVRFQNDYQNEEGTVYISGLRVAVGAPDMRSKLLAEGKLVTHGILFDTNSDRIKNESYGTLKEISQILKDNPAVRVKVVGHTDADGDEKSNMTLSAKRAEAVKNNLVSEFGIAASRFESEGKGESQPAFPNTSAEGKAGNRRVEFIKL
jgi:OmpA-OmpF porin, OOP family